MPCTVSVMEGGGSYSQPELQHGASGMCSTAAMQYQPSQLEIEVRVHSAECDSTLLVNVLILHKTHFIIYFINKTKYANFCLLAHEV